MDFPNKGYVMVEDQKVLVKKRNAWSEDPLCYSEKTFRKSSGPYSGGTGKSPLEKESLYVLHFPSVEAACTRQCHMKSSFI